MTELAGPLVLVGCGKMGGALLHGWLSRGLPASEMLARHGIVVVAEAKALPVDLRPRALVFAVKPQAIAAVLPAYRRLAESGAVVLSIAAGTAIARARISAHMR